MRRLSIRFPLAMSAMAVALRHGAAMLAGIVCALMLPDAAAAAPAGQPMLRVAVTTSFLSSGAAARLVPAFEAHSGCRVELLAVGGGAAFRMARMGAVEATLTHSPDEERAFIADGLAAAVQRVMSSHMLIAGPAGDPAAARGPDAVAALVRIAAAGQPFVSRGDDSGTHALERALWRQAGVDPLGRPWYLETGSRMDQALLQADRLDAYVLVDRGTWLNHRAVLRLAPLVGGDARLVTEYVAIAAADAGRKAAPAALAWVHWLGSAQARRIIAGLAVDGELLFVLPPQPPR